MVEHKKNAPLVSKLEKIFVGILLVIFGGIVLQAPISVGLGTLWPDYDLLIKSWKEILMAVAGLMLLYILYRKKRFGILRDPLLIAIAAYGALHLLLFMPFWQGIASSIAGLMIDLRYVLYFGLVYIALKLYPAYVRLFIKVGIAGALVVLVFALLQVTILPADILKYIGYNTHTIVPYLTVDQNHAFIRINSTLRGPNPLGAYAGIVLALLAAFIAKRHLGKQTRPQVIAGILAAGGIIAVWVSYSRSALIAAIIAILIVVIVTTYHTFSRKVWIISCVVVVALVGGLMMLKGTSFVSNVLLHENPNGGSAVNSNEGHINSLQDALGQLVYQPFGAGIGSTGSASLYGTHPLIIENQYLFTAHEIGWLGLLLFLGIFVWILRKLWQRRSDWLALGIFASGIGLALIGLLLPVWVDDTVSIIWWGLAGVAIGSLRAKGGENKKRAKK